MADRTLTAGVITELSKGVVRPALFVEMIFDSGAVRLWTGYRDFTFNGNVFTGAGQLGGIDKIQESAGDIRGQWTQMYEARKSRD